jgi:intracellular sulfur oxidation DsrE/DsrF family protein
MTDEADNAIARRALMAGMGAAAVAGLVVASSAEAQTGSRRSSFTPARHKLDAWFGELPGTHRVFVDSASATGGATALGYANNLLVSTDNAYPGEDAAMAVVVCFRHMSTPFGYGDAVWAKYGEVFHSMIQFADPTTNAAPKINLLNSTAHGMLPNRGTTIDALVAKGVHYAICNTASRGIAGVVAQRTGGNAEAVYQEFAANLIPKGRLVSAGVMALTRAQEYGYSVLISG